MLGLQHDVTALAALKLKTGAATFGVSLADHRVFKALEPVEHRFCPAVQLGVLSRPLFHLGGGVLEPIVFALLILAR